MSKFTQDKWENDREQIFYRDKDGNRIFFVKVLGDYKQACNDACLIANALEMYKLLIKILDDTQNGQFADENAIIRLLNDIDGENRKLNPFYA